MVLGKTKRIVVIKDIRSNIIEEAIIILKSEPGTNETKDWKSIIKGNKNKSNDYILKEAQYIINDYIKESRLVGGTGIELKMKEVTASKKKFLTGLTINLALAGSIALLIFIVLKML